MFAQWINFVSVFPPCSFFNFYCGMGACVIHWVGVLKISLVRNVFSAGKLPSVGRFIGCNFICRESRLASCRPFYRLQFYLQSVQWELFFFLKGRASYCFTKDGPAGTLNNNRLMTSIPPFCLLNRKDAVAHHARIVGDSAKLVC